MKIVHVRCRMDSTVKSSKIWFVWGFRRACQIRNKASN